MTRVVEQNSTSPRRPFFEALLNDQVTVPTDAQPRTNTGDAIFLTGTTKVAEQEALLFHDDLTMTTGRVPWLIEVLQRLQKLSPAVCRLETSAPGDRRD